MNRLFILLTLATALLLTTACGDETDSEAQQCSAMTTAINDSEGSSCSGADECPSIPCACADGSVINTSSCMNNTCAGLTACEDVCDSVLECSDDTPNDNQSNQSNQDDNNDDNIEVGDGTLDSVCAQHSDCDSNYCYAPYGGAGECKANDLGTVCDSQDDCEWRICVNDANTGTQYCSIPCSDSLACPSNTGISYGCEALGMQTVCSVNNGE